MPNCESYLLRFLRSCSYHKLIKRGLLCIVNHYYSTLYFNIQLIDHKLIISQTKVLSHRTIFHTSSRPDYPIISYITDLRTSSITPYLSESDLRTSFELRTLYDGPPYLSQKLRTIQMTYLRTLQQLRTSLSDGPPYLIATPYRTSAELRTS